MTRLTTKRPTIDLGSAASRVWRAWRERGERPAQALLLTAGVASFLSAAGTLHAVYTLQVSYVLAATGILVGAPWAFSGWSNSGSWLRWSSVALIIVYLISMLAGHPGSISGSSHTGRSRELVYMADLCVGLGTVGVIAGALGGRDRSRAMFNALLCGAVLAAAYAVYQWFGLHFHWPLTRINNTLNSNGVTSGASQGAGPLGWERAQGTFLEPHFLGAYLAALWPLCAGAALSAARPRAKRCLWSAALLILVGLLTSGSAPAWASLIGVCVATMGAVAVAQHRPALAALAVSSIVGALALLPVTGIQGATAAATGRSAGTITLTTQFRTATWSRALNLWAHEPILGSGPGQASIRLTYAGVDQALFPKLDPGVLLSAQGLWAAALLDTGLLGLTAWLLFLGGMICFTARSVFRSFSYHVAALLAAVVIALLGSLTAGDRLELWVWLLLGTALAAASDGSRSAARHGRQESGKSAQRRA
jgi:O-antigen ligase